MIFELEVFSSIYYLFVNCNLSLKKAIIVRNLTKINP